MKKTIIMLVTLLLIPFTLALNLSSSNYRINLYTSSAADGYERLDNNYTAYYGLDQTHIGNETATSYNAQTGMYYEVLGQLQNYVPPSVLIHFILGIKDFGIEWLKINFT